jgi:predicted nucleic acid-binding protein
MIVVLDTNVLVAGLLKPFGPSAAVLRLAAHRRARLPFESPSEFKSPA